MPIFGGEIQRVHWLDYLSGIYIHSVVVCLVVWINRCCVFSLRVSNVVCLDSTTRPCYGISISVCPSTG